MPIYTEKDPLPIINQGECHIACVLLVDTSSSMSGKPITELNQGMVEFGEALRTDSLALGRAEVCVISFDSSVNTEMSFRPASQYEAPKLEASGITSMNAAIDTALDVLEARKAEYRENGVRYYRPWLFLLTDGAPTDVTKESIVQERLRNAIRNKKVVYMPMGIGAKADIKKLQSYYPQEATVKPVLKASANNFKEAFTWLSASISEVSHSDPSIASEIKTPPTPSCITIGL